MKTKLKIVLGSCLLAMAAFALNSQAQTQFQYMNRTFLAEDSGDLFVVSECTEYAGSGCTHPGSAHRINISAITRLF